MPSVRENVAQWNTDYDWEGAGDEWSGPWGGTESMWWGVLMPRLHRVLPAQSVLELGPGFGRWTQYLKDHAERLIVVDMAERCIEACRERFGSSANIAYHVNDGRSLEMVPDDSVDLVFSFDSLVHAEADILRDYLAQIAGKLTPDGIGFIHHSNMGVYARQAELARRVPELLRGRLVMWGLLVNVYGWRAETVTAELFESLCREAGLACVGQERVNWAFGRHLTDCISMFTRPDSRWSRPNRRLDNRGFRALGSHLIRQAPLYSQWPSRTEAAPRNAAAGRPS